MQYPSLRIGSRITLSSCWFYWVECAILSSRKESEVSVIPSLEAVLQLNPCIGAVIVRKKTKVTTSGSAIKRVSRFPEPSSVHACDSIASIAVAEGLECTVFASNKVTFGQTCFTQCQNPRRDPTLLPGGLSASFSAVSRDRRLSCKEVYVFVTAMLSGARAHTHTPLTQQGTLPPIVH